MDLTGDFMHGGAPEFGDQEARSGALLRCDRDCRVLARTFTSCTMRQQSFQRAPARPLSRGAASIPVNRRRLRAGSTALTGGGPLPGSHLPGDGISGGSVRSLALILHDKAGPARRHVEIDRLVIGGWTGRDKAAVEKHIAELEALGVKRPASTPIFYRAGAARLTTDAEIEVLGEASSGEAEFVLLRHDGRLWIGAGSDHTDREVEKYGVSVSKQMCDKPIAPVFWPFDEVAPHWQRLTLRAHIVETGQRTLYQEGPVTAMLDPLDLIDKFAGATGLADGTLMFCGTLTARGGVRPAADFAFELDDPVLGRKIEHSYRARTLPVLG
jgi:Protein of unknown function (DUF2848)